MFGNFAVRCANQQLSGHAQVDNPLRTLCARRPSGLSQIENDVLARAADIQNFL